MIPDPLIRDTLLKAYNNQDLATFQRAGIDACLEHGLLEARTDYLKRACFKIVDLGLAQLFSNYPFKVLETSWNRNGYTSYHAKLEQIELRGAYDRVIRLTLDGDCRSDSYFEKQSLEEVKNLVDQTISRIEHVESARTSAKDGTCRYHGLKITTETGVVVLDWRNESDGYYDGTCEVEGWDMFHDR